MPGNGNGLTLSESLSRKPRFPRHVQTEAVTISAAYISCYAIGFCYIVLILINIYINIL